MKLVKLNECAGATPPHHSDMVSYALFGKQNGSNLGFSISYYLPGGGADMGPQPVEVVYYVLEGTITVKGETEEFVLQSQDVLHVDAGTMKSIRNTGKTPATLFVLANLEHLPPMPPAK